jgi:hypothetical protein
MARDSSSATRSATDRQSPARRCLKSRTSGTTRYFEVGYLTGNCRKRGSENVSKLHALDVDVVVSVHRAVVQRQQPVDSPDRSQ